MQRVQRLAVTSACLAVLALAAPSPPAAVGVLQRAGHATDPVLPVVAVLAVLAWTLGAWLALTGLLAALARVPGHAGRLAAAGLGRVAPRAVRRAVEVALGLGVAAGGLCPGGPAAAAERPAATAASEPAAPSSGPPAPPADDLDLDWPADDAVTTPASGAGTSDAAAGPSPVAVDQGTATVVVRRGDSLWRLAERALADAARSTRADAPPPTAAQVAAAWPAWWAANRDVIGDDPHRISPGATLRLPAGPTAAAPD